MDTAYGDDDSGYKNIYNYGFISGYIFVSSDEKNTTHITNYGEMGGVKQNNGGKPIVIDNYGVINLINNGTKAHFDGINLTIKNYAINISSGASAFNAFSGTTQADNSHLILNGGGSVSFADKNSKIILDFGNGFELGKEYLLSKLVVDTSGTNKLNVGFDRLTTRTSLYKLTQSGDNFIVSLDAPNSEIGILHKANIRTMNNLYTISNSMIYPRKSYYSQNLTNKNQNNLVILRERSDRRISKSNIIDSSPKAQNDNVRKLQNLKETQNTSQTQTFLQNLTQNPNDYYFILTPFINHNLFFESGNYNLSGFDYGFLTAFSTQVAESNSLGAHFIFSYGSLGDSKDKDLSIKSLNLNVGINYKLDLVYNMYLKARGDFYYFSNTLDSLTIKNIKPNNLGFGASVIFGKDFNFGKGGVLGIEAGLDYKALKTNEVSLNSQTYKQSLYNLIYADVGINYNKYFGGFGINLGTGFKANLAPKLAESILILNTQNLTFTLDNDKYLGYANAGISYLLNTKNFDMEFSLAYYGNFGDRVISNGGGVEWRTTW